ncbi:MAG: SDR family oxidoreductase [Chitinophagales bacterium]
MKNILITGAGGFLGSHLVELAKLNYNVYGLSNISKINLPNEKCVYLNLIDEKKLNETLNRIKPQVIIHCAAISGESGCRSNREEAYAINVSATLVIAEWCQANQAKMIFTSTDLVFDGSNAPYKEVDRTLPSMEYGKLKVEAEILLQSFKKTIIVRLPLLYGMGLGDNKGLLHQFVENAKDGKVQRLFTDEFRTPVLVDDIAKFIIQLVDSTFTGILHLGGKERLSRFELGQLFCKKLNLNQDFIQPILRKDINMDYRPKDTSMDSSKAYKIGFQPKKIGVALQAIFTQYYNR